MATNITTPSGKVPHGKYYTEYLTPTTPDPRRQKLWNRYGTRYGWERYQAPATTPPPTTQPTPQPQPQPFKTVQDFMQKDWSADPLYQQSMAEGQKYLDRSMAAKGLTGSGAQDEARTNMSSALLADQTGRMYDQALQNYNAWNTQAAAEAGRLERQGTNTWGMITDLLNMYLGQNPTGMGASAAGQGASMKSNLGSALASIAASMGTPYQVTNQQPNYSSSYNSSANNSDLMRLFTGLLPYMGNLF